MAGFVENLLRDAVRGFVIGDYLRDYTHASKTFRTNSYAYAPKYKFLFHVYFDINYEGLGGQFVFPNGMQNYFGLAVKSVQLPKFTLDLHTMNQYNRARVVQTKVKYDPIQIKLHDDNDSLIRKLWFNYYAYYYKDTLQREGNNNEFTSPFAAFMAPTQLSGRNIYDPDIGYNDDWGYVGETSNSQLTNWASSTGQSKVPFFKSIDIYGFNQHNFVLYRLMNPIIESFSHDTYDYSQGNGVMENTLVLRYENVKYLDGAMSGNFPGAYVPEFGSDEFYDRSLSPIARPGSNATILGRGGLLDAAGGFMQDLATGNYLGAVQKAAATANTFKNPQNILRVAGAEAVGIAINSVTRPPNTPTAFNFPVADITRSVNSGISSLGSFLTGPPSI